MKVVVWFLLIGTLLLGSCQRDEMVLSDQAKLPSAQKEAMWLIKAPAGQLQSKAVGVEGKYWNSGDTIRIKFLDEVDAIIQDKIREYAAIWLNYVNLHFEYVGAAEEADVKIGFNTEGRWVSWSTIGTDCKLIPQDEASLNYIWWEDDSEALIKSEVLRGIGHVLGLGFEHRNPGSTVVFKPDADIAGEYNLSASEVQEFKTLYTTDQTNYTSYDKNSVMTVSIGRTLVTKPNLATTYNSELSDMDKAFIQSLYPPCLMTLTYGMSSINICVHAVAWNPPVGVRHDSRFVDWGDGTRQFLPFDDYYNKSYQEPGEHVIRFYGLDTTYQLLYVKEGVVSIDVTKNPNLKTLYCWYSPLASLDVSRNTELVNLVCDETPFLTELDVSNKKDLEMLTCSESGVQSVNVQGCQKLKELSCFKSPSLAEVKFSDNVSLETFNCSGCDLKSLNIEGAINLKEFRCGGNRSLAEVKFSNNVGLQIFDCSDCDFRSLNMGEAINLKELYCARNRSLTTLDVSNNRELTVLDCSECDLASVNIGGCLKLRDVYCYGNRFSAESMARQLPDRSKTSLGNLFVWAGTDSEEVKTECKNRNWRIWVRVQPGVKAYSPGEAEWHRPLLLPGEGGVSPWPY